MKNIAHGIILTIISILVIVAVAVIGTRSIRKTKVDKILATAVDNSVEEVMANGTYTIDSREEFIAEILEELVDSYYTSEIDIDDKTGAKIPNSEKISNLNDTLTVEIMGADADKGLLSVKATVEYEKVLGMTGKAEYTRTCILAENVPEGYATIVFKLDDDTQYKKYTLQMGEDFPRPQEPTKDGYVFSFWEDENGEKVDIPDKVTAEWNGKILKAHFIKVEQIVFVSGIDVTSSRGEDYLAMEMGDQDNLVATIIPKTATIKKVNWISSNPNVVSVDENGKITAVGIGSCHITATTVGLTADGISLSDGIDVNVSEITKIYGDISELASSTTLTKQLNVLTAKKIILNPENYGIKFTSTDTSIATVTKNGSITIKDKEGFALIKAAMTKADGSELVVKVPVYRYNKSFVKKKDLYINKTVYNGKNHKFKVSCGNSDEDHCCEVSYEYNGKKQKDPFKFKKVGKYPVKYTLIYTSKKGNKYEYTSIEEVEIEKGEAVFTFDEDEDEYYYPQSKEISFDLIKNTCISDYSLFLTKEDESEIQNGDGLSLLLTSVDGEGRIRITPTGEKKGTYIIKLVFNGSEAIESKTIKHIAHVYKGQMKVTANSVTANYDSEAHSPSVYVENKYNPDNEYASLDSEFAFCPTIIFSESSECDDSGNFVNPIKTKSVITTIDENGNEVESTVDDYCVPAPTYGTHKYFYQVRCDRFETVSGSVSVSIAPIDDDIVIDNHPLVMNEGENYDFRVVTLSGSDISIVADETDSGIEAVVQEVNEEEKIDGEKPSYRKVNVKVKNGAPRYANITIVSSGKENFYKSTKKTLKLSIGEIDGIYDYKGEFIGTWAGVLNNITLEKNYSSDENNELYYKNDCSSLYYALADETTNNIDNKYKKIILPSTTKNIGSYALYKVADEIVIPDSIESIDEKAFDDQTVICYNGKLNSGNNWGAKANHEYENGKCKYCGIEEVEISSVENNEEPGDEPDKKEKSLFDFPELWKGIGSDDEQGDGTESDVNEKTNKG